MLRYLKPRHLAVGAIRFYQKLVSGRMAANCRYQPTCSQYAAEAIQRFGSLKGIWLGMKRIGRCHPLRAGGYDPVPKQWRTN